MKVQLQKIIRSGFFVILVMVSGFFMSHVALALKGAFEPKQIATVPIQISDKSDSVVLGEKEDDMITIGFVGDIAPAHQENEFEIENFFAQVMPYLQSPDIMIGNLEGTFSMMGTPKCDESIPGCYLFSGSQSFLDEIKRSEFDVLSLANNHAYDYGKEGFDETKRLISLSGMLAVGGRNDIRYKETSLGTVAFVGGSSYFWSPSIIETDDLIRHINEAKKNADIIIVTVHAGAEGRDYSHTPDGVEWYMGENRGDVRMMARRAIDEGADLILGSGPHVLRGMEIYKQRLIAYSLGNFAFSGTKTISQKGDLGVSAILHATLTSDGEFTSGKIIPIQISPSGYPTIDQSNKAIEKIQYLSKEDFMYSGVNITNDGTILIPAN